MYSYRDPELTFIRRASASPRRSCFSFLSLSSSWSRPSILVASWVALLWAVATSCEGGEGCISMLNFTNYKDRAHIDLIKQTCKMLTSPPTWAMNRKAISRGAEWCKVQLPSTFHFEAKGPQTMTSISVKTPYYSPGFLPKI